jgi:C-terminal processing protease CtpA/Prc
MLNSEKKSLFFRKNLWLEVFLFVFIALAVNSYFQIERSKLANLEVCQVIADNYLEGLTAQEFKNCKHIVESTDFSNSAKIQKLNSWLRTFHISHLYIYNSKENKKMWYGQSRETGIIVKKIFNKWRVTQVLVPRSYVQVGDEILKINGKKIKSIKQVATTEGHFEILRQGQPMAFSIKYSDIVYDERMVVKPVNADWRYLKIPSFKSDFFGYDELARVFPELYQKNLIIDIRDNFGGNFISIVRLLSMVTCDDDQVGRIFHNRSQFAGENYLRDDLSDMEQITQVTQTNPVYLKLFKTELCLNTNKIVVLMNERTASVSELFVQILKNQFPNINIFGTNTAGQMVLSIWYPLKYFGPDVLISIPYAWATANDKEILEGMGASPTQPIEPKKIQKFIDSIDPLYDYVLEHERIEAQSKSSFGGASG